MSPGIMHPGNGTDIGKIAPEYAAEAKKIYQSIEAATATVENDGREATGIVFPVFPGPGGTG